MSTKIEWAQETWNPITGCRPISEGCENCYAKRMANRLRGRFGYHEVQPFQITSHFDKLQQPLKWKKPRKVFVCSMGDLFHEQVPDRWLDRVFDAMLEADHHTYLILTKRPERMAWYVEKNCLDYPFLWYGVTAENQVRWNARVSVLMSIPNKGIHFVSVEPMLGKVTLADSTCRWPDWVICGPETGPKARRMDGYWADILSSQCISAQIPFFLKRQPDYWDTPYDCLLQQYPEGVVA